MRNGPKLLRFFFFCRKEFNYLIDDHPPTADPKYADWRVEDAQIRS